MKNQNSDNSNSPTESSSESSNLSDEPPLLRLTTNFSPENVSNCGGTGVYPSNIYLNFNDPKMIVSRINNDFAGQCNAFKVVITGEKS